MTESERTSLLKDAPRLVQYGLQKGWLEKPNRNGLSFKQQKQRREEFYKNLTAEQALEAETWEAKRPTPDQYNNTVSGYRAYRYAYKNWARQRARAVAKVTL